VWICHVLRKQADVGQRVCTSRTGPNKPARLAEMVCHRQGKLEVCTKQTGVRKNQGPVQHMRCGGGLGQRDGAFEFQVSNQARLCMGRRVHWPCLGFRPGRQQLWGLGDRGGRGLGAWWHWCLPRRSPVRSAAQTAQVGCPPMPAAKPAATAAVGARSTGMLLSQLPPHMTGVNSATRDTPDRAS
jgi:hypothetical protein